MASSIKTILFTRTAEYRHACIPSLINALSSLPSLTVTHTESLSELRERLLTHDVLVLGHNTRNFLDDETLDALKEFMEREGTGVVGVHAATAGMLKDEWYANLFGARFNGHPEPQWGRVQVHYSTEESTSQEEHFILRDLPLPSASSVPTSAPPCPDALRSSQASRGDFPWFDEWYNFTPQPTYPPKDCKVLVSVDPSTYEGWHGDAVHQANGQVPLAWCHEHITGRTRVFYTALGHFDEAYTDPWFMGMLERGIWWTARLDK
ncbi:class I glutamine amidotransferase-like protein [Sarocladium strictum]